MKRKIESLLLVLAMIAAYMPTFAFAETTVDSKMLLFEEATELEENGDYLIVAGTTAMTNEDGELGSQTVTVNNGRIIISEADAEKSIFSVEEWRYLGVSPHHSAKLKNNGKYLSGDKDKVLNLVNNSEDAEIFNTWDTPNRLCGLGLTLKWINDSSEWKAVSGVGINAVTYKKVDSVTVSFSNPLGLDPDAQVLKKNEKATKPADPEKEGYLFMGWYNGNEEWNFNTSVTEDITLVAKWDKAVKYELANELEKDGEYIIVNRNSANNDARVMQAVGDNLNFFNASVNAKKEVIIGEKQSENSLFKASDYYKDGDLKKAKLSLGDKYIGKNNDDRLVLVDEEDGGIFNTWNYDDDGYKLCGYGYWIRCTGNNTGLRDGGWWPTTKYDTPTKKTGAYLYKKASYEAEVAVKDYEKLCTDEDPIFEAVVTGTEDFPCDIEYTISREKGDECGEYTIAANGEKKQANYSVEYVDGTLTIKHVLKKVEGVQPTAEKAGYRYAYKCVGCGEYFEDADGTKPIGDQAAYDKWISKGGAGYLEKSPKTGDDNNIIFYGLTAILALLGAGSVYGFRRREHR